MKTVSYANVRLKEGYLRSKEELNRNVTIHAVYDRFFETGRIGAFACDWKEGMEHKPHYFWDSDVAKWIEGASYILQKDPDPDLETKIEAIVDNIEKNQGADGYFNIYFTVCEPDKRFSNRDWHELYCAGHLMEAAVAYAEATGRTRFLSLMEKYADYIETVFLKEKSAAFFTPGHEEIELALVKMYRHTKKKKYLDMAAYFINTRGTIEETGNQYENFQSHAPVREQKEALGHAVRALYLYTGMASLARETGEASLIAACKTLWQDVTACKMYVTGALGSTHRGEAFSNVPYDLPNGTAYAETCAAIALLLFGREMLALENDAKYADAIERALYNGVLAGLSLSGDAFFYENPLEINLSERRGDLQSRYSITQRVACFDCSCCPPNLNRLLASLGGYIYGREGDTLYVNQFVDSTLSEEGISCLQATDYPRNGCVKLQVTGVKRVAVRVPEWCDKFTLNKPYVLQNGYAVVENDGGEILLELDLAPRAVFADPRVWYDSGRLCVMRGPVVYCAEGVDNGEHLHSYTVPINFSARELPDEGVGLPALEIACCKQLPLVGRLYANTPPKTIRTALKLIPYSAFANRGESDMLVWLRYQ